MFYSAYILTQKGTYAKIWLAAHYDKKLTKTQVLETDIVNAVGSVIDPVAPLALRTSSHLLLGIVKIFSRKVRYTLSECNEALAKIKLQAMPAGKVDLPERSLKATFASITLPERLMKIDLTIPDLELSALREGTRLSLRPEDITIDLSDIPMLQETAEGWVSLGPSQADEDVAMIEALRTPSIRTPGTPYSIISEKEAAREAVHVPITMVDFPEAGGPDFYEFDVTDTQRRLSTAMGLPSPQLSAAGTDEFGTPYMGAPVTPAGYDVSLGLVQPAAEARGRKKRKLQLDQTIEISNEDMRRQLGDSSHLVRQLRSIPRTRRALEDRQVTMEDLYKRPSLPEVPDEFLPIFNMNAVVVPLVQPEIERPMPGHMVTPMAPGLATTPQMVTPGFPEAEFQPVDFEEEFLTPAMTTPGPMVTTPASMGVATPGMLSPPSFGVRTPEITSTAKKRRRTRETVIGEEYGVSAEGDEEEIEQEKQRRLQQLKSKYAGTGITERTLKVLGVLQESFKERDELSFHTMIAGKKRMTAAASFFELLVIKSKDLIDVTQKTPYGDILITKTESFNRPEQQQMQA